MDSADIPNIPDREQRFAEITVDCYDEYEALSAFQSYMTDTLRTPFAATCGTPGTAQTEHVTVLAVAGADEREGVRFRVRSGDGAVYEVLADQVWADQAAGSNAIVLDDYRAYVAAGGLSIDADDEEE